MRSGPGVSESTGTSKANSFSCAHERLGKRNLLMKRLFFGSREFRTKGIPTEVTP